jgi:hypothetical protein
MFGYVRGINDPLSLQGLLLLWNTDFSRLVFTQFLFK